MGFLLMFSNCEDQEESGRAKTLLYFYFIYVYFYKKLNKHNEFNCKQKLGHKLT